MIAVIIATERELRAMREVLTDEKTETGAAGRVFYRGRCGRNDVVVTRSGSGKVNAAICAQEMIDTYHPTAVINAGAAGALAPDLHVLEVVIARDLLQHDIDTSFFGDPLGWIDGIPTPEVPADENVLSALAAACEASGLTYREGRVLTGDGFISSDAKKAWLAETFDGTCVEMEGAAVAQTCWLNKVPFGIIRAISDGSGDGNVMEYEEFALRAARNAAAVVSNLPELA